MYVLYGLLLILGIMALFILIIPLRKNWSSITAGIKVSIFLLFFAFTVYHFTGNKPALYAWLAEGQSHYNLLAVFEKLGGVQGAIENIKNKLEKNPGDAKGWLILGKLYLARFVKLLRSEIKPPTKSMSPPNQIHLTKGL